MEAKILSGVLSSETHVRQVAGDQLLEYLRDDSNNIAEFEELDRLIGGLVAWMGSSNFRVSQKKKSQCHMVCGFGQWGS